MRIDKFAGRPGNSLPVASTFTHKIMQGVTVAVMTMVLAMTTAYADDRDDKSRAKEMSYTKAMFLNSCSQDYYNFFSPGDKLDAKGQRQMVRHIKASCKCLYKNLRKVFKELDIMHYIQSQHVSRQASLDMYGQTPDRVFELLTSEKMRETCYHLNDMGASYGEDD